MGVGHSRSLLVHDHTAVHRMAPEAKVAATVLFVLALVATPREAFWAFATAAAVLVVVSRLARLSSRQMAKRLVLELPFLGFAFFLPFVGRGERVDVLGVSLSEAGLWGAWNILAKGTLGVTAAVILASTTSVPALLRGLERLHLPNALVQIMSFMVRYLEVILGEMSRMRIARVSRGSDPRWIWQVRAVTTSAGALFIRAYERGERVHTAMLARGYDGHLPELDEAHATRSEWQRALSVPLVMALVAGVAWMLR